MQIQIRHRTQYTYSAPLLTSAQYLRLTPRSGPSQSINRWGITCQGASLTEWVDHFGNICHTLVTDRSRGEIVLEVTGEAHTYETHGVQTPAPDEMPGDVYLRPSPYTLADPKLRKFAAGFRKALRSDRLEAMHALMMAIHDEVVYDDASSHVHTTAAEAFTEGLGVCQDHAHIFVACCKHLGVPARYVSGYMADDNMNQEYNAGHAWAETLIPDLGWVSFDAANGMSATEAYVRTAVGFDYADAGPVRGVRIGGGDEEMTVGIRLDSQ